MVFVDKIWADLPDVSRAKHGAAGAHLLFLSTYNPDLSPRATMFAELESLLRKAGERSIAAVWQRIGSLLREFTPAAYASSVLHAGYDAM